MKHEHKIKSLPFTTVHDSFVKFVRLTQTRMCLRSFVAGLAHDRFYVIRESEQSEGQNLKKKKNKIETKM